MHRDHLRQRCAGFCDCWGCFWQLPPQLRLSCSTLTVRILYAYTHASTYMRTYTNTNTDADAKQIQTDTAITYYMHFVSCIMHITNFVLPATYCKAHVAHCIISIFIYTLHTTYYIFTYAGTCIWKMSVECNYTDRILRLITSSCPREGQLAVLIKGERPLPCHQPPDCQRGPCSRQSAAA